MIRSLTSAICVAGVACSLAQVPAAPQSYLVKLGVSVSADKSKPGDRIRAAVISPESLLNGYLEGVVEEAASGRLVLRFRTLVYRGKSTALDSQVIDFVNSKGHKAVDDSERPVRLGQGAFVSESRDIWLDEGAELRVRVNPHQSGTTAPRNR